MGLKDVITKDRDGKVALQAVYNDWPTNHASDTKKRRDKESLEGRSKEHSKRPQTSRRSMGR